MTTPDYVLDAAGHKHQILVAVHRRRRVVLICRSTRQEIEREIGLFNDTLIRSFEEVMRAEKATRLVTMGERYATSVTVVAKLTPEGLEVVV